MTHNEALHDLIETMTDQAGDEPITRQALRDACEMLSLFPEHRFRKAFHQALTALAASGVIVLEDDDTITLIETPAELQEVRAAQTVKPAGRSPDDPYGERFPADKVPAACDKLYPLIEAACGPENVWVNPDVVARGQMDTQAIDAATLALKRQGRLEGKRPSSPRLVRLAANFPTNGR